MHFIGPRRSLQFQPAYHGHHFLPVRHAQARLRRRHRHRFRRHEILFGQQRPAQIAIDRATRVANVIGRVPHPCVVCKGAFRSVSRDVRLPLPIHR